MADRRWSGPRTSRSRAEMTVARSLVTIVAALVAAATVAAQRRADPSPAPADGVRAGASTLADGTREMAAELARRAAALGPGDLWFNLNDKRADAFEKDLEKPRAPLDALRARHLYANELLFAGRYPDAIAQTD